MRRAGTAVLMACLAFGSAGCAESAAIAPLTPPPRAPAAIGEIPSWLPPYDAAQRALLTPPAAEVPVPAARVYPLLEHFDYAALEPFDSARKAARLASFISAVLEKSRHTYVIGPMRPELENTTAQYGPRAPDEPDPWQRLETTKEGHGFVAVVADGTDPKRSYQRAMAKRDEGDVEGAIELLRYAAVTTPAAPLGIALGDLLVEKRDEAGALAAYGLALRADPSAALTHIRIAELHERAGRRELAKQAIAEALAYHPTSHRALEVADRLSNGRATLSRSRAPRFRVFLDVDDQGAVHVGYAGGAGARSYAECRAITRYEPLVRVRLFRGDASAPYFLTVGEEMLCIGAAIGGYVAARQKNPQMPDDPEMSALMGIVLDDGLLGYVMFEIFGRHRHERARMAPNAVHRAMVRYVERVVLGGTLVADPQRGMYSAQR